MANCQNTSTSTSDNEIEKSTGLDDTQPVEDSLKDQEKSGNPPRNVTGWKWVLATTAILSSIFLYSLDTTVVADIQATVVEEFDALDDLSWLNTGYLMSATATNMIWGRLYGQFNTKWLYVFNVALFEVGSALCGAAPNISALIVGRVICGIAGCGLYIGVITLIALSTTLAERPLYNAGTGLVWGLGTVLGPVVGGAFQESRVGWRWAFYINLFVGGIFTPAYLFLLPNKDPRPGVPFKDRALEIDYFGGVLLMGAISSFTMAINWGGITYPWNSGQIIGLFVTAGVLVLLLGIQQISNTFTTEQRRLIPVQFFRSRTILLLFSTTAASAAAAFIPIYFVPLFFQFTRNDGALEAGVRLLPLITVLVVGILINGALMAKFGYYMPWYLVGGLLCVAGGALMYTVGEGTSESRVYGYTVLIGLGVGFWIQASFSVAQAVVEPEHVPSAIGVITLAQLLGNTIALAISNSLFLNEANSGIRKLLPDVPVSEIQAAIEGASTSFVQSLSPEVKAQVVEVIVRSINKPYILVITAGSLVALLSLFMKRERLFMTVATAAA